MNIVTIMQTNQRLYEEQFGYVQSWQLSFRFYG